MFIFKDVDVYRVAAQNNAVITFKDTRTGRLLTSVDNLIDLLYCRYYNIEYVSKGGKAYFIPHCTKMMGGRRWSSLKYAIAEELGLSIKEMYKLVNNAGLNNRKKRYWR